MSEHDPLCQASLNGNDDIYFCVCEFIAKVRADERERMLALEAMVETRRRWEVKVLADLRTKVEALITPQGVGSWNSAMEAVLDLIDGGE